MSFGYKPLNDEIAVCGQVFPAQIPQIAEAGFRAIICNRPDGEEPGQPGFDQVAEAARAAGIELRYIPIVPGQAGMDEARQMAEALKELPRPVLAYCRSGARSETFLNAAMQIAGQG